MNVETMRPKYILICDHPDFLLENKELFLDSGNNLRELKERLRILKTNPSEEIVGQYKGFRVRVSLGFLNMRIRLYETQ